MCDLGLGTERVSDEFLRAGQRRTDVRRLHLERYLQVSASPRLDASVH